MEDTYLIRWKDRSVRPGEGRYILIKLWEPGFGPICSNGAYENGMFWLEHLDKPLKEETVLGWTYYPYDEEMDHIFQYKPNTVTN